MTSISIEHLDERHWVGASITVDLEHWDEANAIVPRLYEALAGADVPPLGGPIYQYHRMRTASEPMDVTVSVPVAAPLDLGDGFATGTLPAGRHVIARPDGGPDALDDVHAEMWDWAAMHAVDLAVDHRDDGIHWRARTEQFLTDPESEPDRSRWAIEVAYLVR